MAERTGFLARLIGLYCVLAALVMALQHDAWVAAVTALVHDPALVMLTGVIVVAAGLALVLCHNVWSGGALPVVVTAIGWLSLAKGLTLWLLPPGAAADFYLERLRYAQFYYIYCAVTFAIGLYLSVAGFAAGRRR